MQEQLSSLLRGKRVYLKLIEEEDLGKRVEWLNNPRIQKTLNYDYPVSLAKTQKWFHNKLMDDTRREFSVFNIDTDEHIGFAGLINIEKTTMKSELHAVIGDTKYWGGRSGIETYKLLMDYAFKELGLNKIYGYQLVHNKSAHRVVELLGWTRDGLLRQDLFSHGKLVDRYVVSILKEDWEEKKLRI